MKILNSIKGLALTFLPQKKPVLTATINQGKKGKWGYTIEDDQGNQIAVASITRFKTRADVHEAIAKLNRSEIVIKTTVSN